MKISEFIFETDAGDQSTASLLSVLMFLKKRSEDSDLSAELRTNSLIQLVQNAGAATFNFAALQQAMNDSPIISNLIKSLDKDTVTLKTSADEDDEAMDDEAMDDEAMDDEAMDDETTGDEAMGDEPMPGQAPGAFPQPAPQPAEGEPEQSFASQPAITKPYGSNTVSSMARSAAMKRS